MNADVPYEEEMGDRHPRLEHCWELVSHPGKLGSGDS